MIKKPTTLSIVLQLVTSCFVLAAENPNPAALSAPSKVAIAGEDVEIKFPVEKYKLENGLTVILAEDHSAPIVSYNTWFRVGSRDEEPGSTGIAHLFEHMMFKGAKRYTGEQYDAALTAVGGTNNAFTTRDFTAYYIILPSPKLELAIDLESDRMESLQITEKNLKSELEVVKEERRFRVDTDVVGQFFERIFSSIFKVHPYRWPVIGWMADLEKMNVEKCRDFFSRFYSPSNAIVVVAGDFETPKIKKLIQNYYGKISAHEIKRKPPVTEPAQKEERKVQFSALAQNEYVATVYTAPPTGHPDGYALDLLGSILAGGRSSLLYKNLVYSAQVAESVNADDMTLMEQGMFFIMATLRKGLTSTRAITLIEHEIEKAKSTLYSKEQIARAKTRIMKSYIETLKTIDGKAKALAMNEVALGSYERLFSDLKLYNAITPEKIREVARTYLTTKHRTVVVMEPQSRKISNTEKDETKKANAQ